MDYLDNDTLNLINMTASYSVKDKYIKYKEFSFDREYTFDENSFKFGKDKNTYNIVYLVKLWFTEREYCINNFDHITFWDTSQIKYMNQLFKYKKDFNEILLWDTRNIESMDEMFEGACSYNRDILFIIKRKRVRMFNIFNKSGMNKKKIEDWYNTIK